MVTTVTNGLRGIAGRLQLKQQAQRQLADPFEPTAPFKMSRATRSRLQVGLALAGCLLASSCGGTSARSTAVASTSSTSITTTTTRPPTTTSPPLSGSYLAKWSIGGMLLRLTMTGSKTVEGLAVYRFLFDDGPSHGEAAISGTVSHDELVLRLKPADTGPRGWYLGTIMEWPP